MAPQDSDVGKKGVFVHIKKCGGHSIKVFLFGASGHCKRCDCITLQTINENAKERRVWNKRRPWEIDDWDERFKFAIVRNPFDRLTSVYRFCRDKFPAVDGKSKRYQGTFAEFVELVVDEAAPFGWPYIRQNGWSMSAYVRVHTAPATHYAHHLPFLDYIGLFEDYEKSVRHIYDQLGLEQPRRLVHNHKTNGKDTPHYSTYYDAKTRERAERYYWQDCKMFDYRFEEA
jgi:hypothetical protein